ncbi:cytochrome C [Neisseria weaveri]|uniref:cytochrome C n=1 Tax=Neisseria weaveri TaxID=28091 RepID=UPI000D2F71CE|nr:cytochrome C [Neisseria weaveri]
MKLSAFALTAAAILSLSACGQKAETSVPSDNTAPSSAATETAALQTLSSTDGKITINVQASRFEDRINDNAAHPEGIDRNELTLLQHDAQTGITLYAVNLGEAKSDAKTYFANLKNALKSAENLQDVQVGAATDNRMNYRFTQKHADGTTLPENCIAIHGSSLYNICASGQNVTQDQLAAVLKDVNLAK